MPDGARGVDADGCLTREGSLDRVPGDFRPVVAAAREHVSRVFGPQRLHSAYLYGSIPRGTPVPGRSDLDLLLALHHEPDEADRADVRLLEAELDARFGRIDGVGTLLYSADRLLSEAEHHDLGWFLACLCTPLTGPDLAEQIPLTGPPRCWHGSPTATSDRSSAGCAAAGTPPARRPS